eukprot:gnl/MRDRNA2_/MRDRNA2_52603_c0_seq1.p1 gnl/MRDRNA2_/MRDRNA2_52603_c0~~gnl/MRDRNA2_/MRDRNA2_52603_c0_seq1.p1  ORF type:complete len:230 (+),score=53.76 gnl/MRDRNA2_/MRDRNA2_52603_c0_seq1:122-811(+)
MAEPKSSAHQRRSGNGGCLECAESAAAEIIDGPRFDEPPKPKSCGAEQITGPEGLLPRSSRIDDRPKDQFPSPIDGLKQDSVLGQTYLTKAAGSPPPRIPPKASMISEIRILRDEAIPGISMKEAVLPARREMPIDEVVFFQGDINKVRCSTPRKNGSILPCAVVERQAMQGSAPLRNKDWLLLSKDDEVSDDGMSDSDGEWIEAGVPRPPDENPEYTEEDEKTQIMML